VLPTSGQFSNATVGNATLLPGGQWGSTLSATAPTAVATGFGVNCTTNVGFFTHRTSKEGQSFTGANGRVNICYVDGHVTLKRNSDLAGFDATSPRPGKSTFDTLWSPKDYELEP